MGPDDRTALLPIDLKRLLLQETLTSTCSSYDSAPNPADPAILSTSKLFYIFQTLEYFASVIGIRDLEFKRVAMSQGRLPQNHGFVPSSSSWNLHAFYEHRSQVQISCSNLLTTCIHSRRSVQMWSTMLQSSLDIVAALFPRIHSYSNFLYSYNVG
jgi:hypothetical protein